VRLTEREYPELMKPQPTNSLPLWLSEKEFQRAVVRLAKMCRFVVYHTWTSQHSESGYPDLVMVHEIEDVEIVAELKTQMGQPTYAQWWWLMKLQRMGRDAYLWRPSDWPEIEQKLMNWRRNG